MRIPALTLLALFVSAIASTANADSITIYLLVPEKEKSGHGHNDVSDQPNSVDPLGGWTNTGEQYSVTQPSNMGWWQLYTKTVTTKTELQHTTHLGWGYIYLASGAFTIEDLDERTRCGPKLIQNPNKDTKFNCDRSYKFGNGMTSFFEKYPDVTLIQDVHDPNDHNWAHTKFVNIIPGEGFTGEVCSANVWGDPHVVTYDGFRFDVQPKGEVIFVKQDNSPFEVQGRLTQALAHKPLPAVTTGVAIQGKSPNQPTIQVSMTTATTSFGARLKGFCVLENGADQNSGVIKLEEGDFRDEDHEQNTEKVNRCLDMCAAYQGATGCEMIWDQWNRGCYVHTDTIAKGNNVGRHSCYLAEEAKSEVVYSSGAFGEMEADEENFNSVFQGSSTGIIRRQCADCSGSHKDVYYKRKTSPSTFNAYQSMMVTWSDGHDLDGDGEVSADEKNKMHGDFDIYSTLEDAFLDTNAWTYCNYNDFNHEIGFPRDCGPNGRVNWNWNSLKHGGTKKDIQFSVILENPAVSGPTTVVELPGGHSCPIDLFVDCELQDSMSYDSNDGFHVTVENEGTLITVEYPGLISVHIHVKMYGICYFSMDVNLLDCEDAEDTVSGLLGSPNGNWRDDWMDQDGNTYEIPSGASSFFFEPAFDYVKQNWMVEDGLDSIFCHGGGFDNFEHHDEEYDEEFENEINDAPECCIETCGDDIGCRIDCIALGCDAAEDYNEDPGNDRPNPIRDDPEERQFSFDDDFLCLEEV